VLQVDVPYLPAATVNFTALPEAASDFVMLDAAVKACPARPAGEALLGKIADLAGKFPKNEFAQMTLSRARIAYGDPKEALPWLTQAVVKNAGNFDAVYLSGLANLRLAEQNQGAAMQTYLQAAQHQLLNARELNPESADAAYAYFRAELLGRSELSDTALESALTAWHSAREVGAFAKYAALTHAYLGNTSQAKILLKTLALNTLDPQTATWATSWQQKVAAGASRDDILAEMRAEQAVPAFKEWTIDTKSVMATVRYNAGLDAAQNYLYNQSVNTGSPEKVLMSAPTKR
jgi:tetratricopeptide (TPR) repeat protein